MATQATTDAQAERHEIQLAQPTWALAKALVALLAASTLWSTQHVKWKGLRWHLLQGQCLCETGEPG
jgi:hypothetical protein